MFRAHEKIDRQKIIWDVPYYPQKDINSCWYFGMKMILDAYQPGLMQEHKKKLNSSDIRLLHYYQIDSLPTESPFMQKFGFHDISFEFNLEKDGLHKIVQNLLVLLFRHGPILYNGGHVFPIVGVDGIKGTVIVHYTLPLVYQSHDHGTVNQRFWTGRGSSSSENAQRASVVRGQQLAQKSDPVRNWLNYQNYKILQYAGKEFLGFDRDYIATLSKQIALTITDEEITNEFKMKLGFVGDAPSAQQSAMLMNPMFRNQVKAELIREKVVLHLYGPRTIAACQYLHIPIRNFLEDFSYSLSDDQNFKKIDFAFFHPEVIK